MSITFILVVFFYISCRELGNQTKAVHFWCTCIQCSALHTHCHVNTLRYECLILMSQILVVARVGGTRTKGRRSGRLQWRIAAKGGLLATGWEMFTLLADTISKLFASVGKCFYDNRYNINEGTDVLIEPMYINVFE